MNRTFTVSIGGAAGQGVATPGDIFAKIFARRGLHLNAYNAYQSIIRGGHTFLTIRAGLGKVTNFGDTRSPIVESHNGRFQVFRNTCTLSQPTNTMKIVC